MPGKYILTIPLIFFVKILLAQLPVADFNAPSPVCIDQQISLDNTSTNSTSYEWDFCLGDYENSAVVSDIKAVSTGAIKGFELIYDDNYDLWVGFVLAGSNLYRLDYGSSMLSEPVVSNMGNLSGALSNPEAIAISKNSNGDWIGFIGHLGVDYGITRINFGNDLSSIPTTENLGVLITGRTRGLDLLEDSGNFYLIASAYNTNKIGVLYLGNSLTNSFTPSDIYQFGAFSELSLPTGITALKKDGDFLLYVASQGNGNLTRFNFGNDLTTAPLMEKNFTIGLNSAKKLRIYQEGNKYYAMVGSDTGPITVWDMDLLTATSPAVQITQPNLPIGFAFSLVDSASVKYLNTISSNMLKRAEFKATCFASAGYSFEAEPVLSFSQAGTYPVSLKAKNNDGTDQVTKDLNVTSNQAPSIDITVNTPYCVNETLNFVASSDQTISSWLWDFGDGNSASVQNPSHAYTSSGIYIIRLEVISANGCENLIEKQIHIFDDPIVAFGIVGDLCTNNALQFNNTSVTQGSSPSFFWDFADGATSTVENPQHVYNVPNDYTVSLTVSESGCGSSTSQVISVKEGPNVDFEANSVFEGDPTSFTNNSTGNFITSYAWNFGDGISSSEFEPEHVYDNAGTKSVELTAHTSNGCDNSINENVEILARPDIYFSVKAACSGENIKIDSLIYSSGNPVWDFCLGDYESIATVSDLTTFAGSNTGFEIIYDEGVNEWIGFAVVDSELYRLNYNNSILNVPQITNLGNLSGALQKPEALTIKKNFNGNWVGFIGHLDVDYGITRLNFGSSLNNTPATENIGVLVTGRTRGLDLLEDGGNYYLITSAYNANKIAVLDLKSSLENSFTIADIFVHGAFSELSLPTGITSFKKGGEYLTYVVSQGNGNLTRLNFGSDFSSTPTIENNFTIGLSDAKKLNIYKEAESYYAIVGSDTDPITVWDLENLTESSGATKINQPNLPVAFSFAVVDTASIKYLHTVSSNIYKRIEFKRDCGASINNSDSANPLIAYETSGTYGILLSVGGNSLVKQITISPNTAPDIDFSTSFPISCINNPIDFTAINSSNDIQFYNWDFGDGSTSTAENPSHAYSTPGTYKITLNVTDPDPCDNFTRKSITIYEDPVGTFDSPSGLVCTNQPVTFANTTPDIFDDNETFEWQVDGVTVSNERDLNYEFTSGGTFQIRLITSIPGCANETIENFDVVAGPTLDFTVSDNCVGTLFEFTNTTIGTDITSYTWDFDNGFMSTDENPQPFEYSEPGVYNVTLTTQNLSGCETTIEKPLTVYDLPQISFSNDLACEGAPTQFNDLSTVDNANIESWLWDFDDTNDNNSTDQNALHTFANSGQFDVKLTATTTFGCIDSLEQHVVVKSAPEADFSFDKICLGEEVQFQDQSLPVPGEVLTSWAWNLGGAFSDMQNPVATFDFAIDYDVSLTVTSQNLCSNTIEETITVNPEPVLDFGVEDACSNEAVHFYDATTAQEDPIADRIWQFSDLGSQTDSSVFFMFDNPGVYNVSLDVVTMGGCEYSIEREVTVSPPPTASFDVSSAFGAPPFEVQLTNTSQDAIAYHWDFGGLGTSSEANPTFTFQDEGSYEITLAAIGASGCADTSSITVNALLPDLEVELVQLTIVNNKLILTIQNNGTLAIDSLKAIINLGDQAQLEETIDKSLLPSTNPFAINHTLDLNLASRKIEYICVTLESFLKNIEDSNKVNNTKCNNFESRIVFTQPYPNPASGTLNMNVLSEIESPGSVRLISSLGEVVIQTSFDGVRGKNEVPIDISGIKNGIYLLEVEMGGEKFITRLAISN